MDKAGANSSSFLIKNLLSPPDDNGLPLPATSATPADNEHAMMLVQMKLAFDWLAHLHQLQGQNASEHATARLEQSGREIMSLMENYQPKTQRGSGNSLLDAFDSRPESRAASDKDKVGPGSAIGGLERWDLKVDAETAFRPFNKTHNRKVLQSQACGSKKLVLHRIISLMMPQFRPSVPADDLMNPLTCSLPVSMQQFAMDRMKMEQQQQQLPSGVHPLNRTLSKYPIAPFANDLNVQRFCSINSINSAPHYQSDASTIKSAEQARKDEKGEKRRKRTTFTQEQLNALEHEFQSKKYLTLEERAAIADNLGLSQVQIKIWWQNRRASYKRSKICLVTSSPGDAASSNSDKMPALNNTDCRPKIVVPIPVHVSRRMTVQHGKQAPSMGRSLPTAPSIAFSLF